MDLKHDQQHCRVGNPNTSEKRAENLTAQQPALCGWDHQC